MKNCIKNKKRFSEIYCITCEKYEDCLRKITLRKQIKEYRDKTNENLK